jgi:hypothetical protein
LRAPRSVWVEGSVPVGPRISAKPREVAAARTRVTPSWAERAPEEFVPVLREIWARRRDFLAPRKPRQSTTHELAGCRHQAQLKLVEGW